MKNLWDIHNHILPGIDDGAQTTEEALEMLGEEYLQGVRNIVFTPHYRAGMFPVPSAVREETFLEFKETAGKHFPDMNFYLGCELHVRKDIGDLFADPICRMAGKKIVLLELSGDISYYILTNYINEAIEAGLMPIIAHAERCEIFYAEPERALALRYAGAKIQINADTFLEGFLSKRKKFAHMLLKEKAVDFIGSDAHGMRYRPVRIGDCIRVLEKKYGTRTVKKIFVNNPEAAFGFK